MSIKEFQDELLRKIETYENLTDDEYNELANYIRNKFEELIGIKL